jgi:Ca2+-binding EF-hand superfamily protein
MFLYVRHLMEFLLAVAFRLYDLRGTGFIEREEVCIFNYLLLIIQ